MRFRTRQALLIAPALILGLVGQFYAIHEYRPFNYRFAEEMPYVGNWLAAFAFMIGIFRTFLWLSWDHPRGARFRKVVGVGNKWVFNAPIISPVIQWLMHIDKAGADKERRFFEAEQRS